MSKKTQRVIAQAKLRQGDKSTQEVQPLAFMAPAVDWFKAFEALTKSLMRNDAAPGKSFHDDEQWRAFVVYADATIGLEKLKAILWQRLEQERSKVSDGELVSALVRQQLSYLAQGLGRPISEEAEPSFWHYLTAELKGFAGCQERSHWKNGDLFDKEGQASRESLEVLMSCLGDPASEREMVWVWVRVCGALPSVSRPTALQDGFDLFRAASWPMWCVSSEGTPMGGAQEKTLLDVWPEITQKLGGRTSRQHELLPLSPLAKEATAYLFASGLLEGHAPERLSQAALFYLEAFLPDAGLDPLNVAIPSAPARLFEVLLPYLPEEEVQKLEVEQRHAWADRLLLLEEAFEKRLASKLSPPRDLEARREFAVSLVQVLKKGVFAFSSEQQERLKACLHKTPEGEQYLLEVAFADAGSAPLMPKPRF